MRVKLIVYSATCCIAVAAAWATFGAGGRGQYLAVWDNRVWNEGGAVRTLAPPEFAFVSPGGARGRRGSL